MALVLAVLVGFVPIGARAEPAENTASARALFHAGRELAAVGRYAEACLKFEESLRLDRGMGTQFNLADCWEHLGRTASAWALFLDVAAAAQATGQHEKEQAARRRADALLPKLSYLVIDVAEAGGSITVYRGDAIVRPATWGMPVPVDPGKIQVIATAPKRRSWAQEVDVPAGPRRVRVLVPRLSEHDPSPSSGPLRRPESGPESGTRRWVGLSLVAIGAAGTTAAAVFAIRSARRENEASRVCPDAGKEGCQRDEIARYDDLAEQARRNRTYAWVGAGIGAGAIIGAVLSFSGAFAAPAREARVRFGVSPSGFGAELASTF